MRAFSHYVIPKGNVRLIREGSRGGKEHVRIEKRACARLRWFLGLWYE